MSDGCGGKLSVQIPRRAPINGELPHAAADAPANLRCSEKNEAREDLLTNILRMNDFLSVILVNS